MLAVDFLIRGIAEKLIGTPPLESVLFKTDAPSSTVGCHPTTDNPLIRDRYQRRWLGRWSVRCLIEWDAGILANLLPSGKLPRLPSHPIHQPPSCIAQVALAGVDSREVAAQL